MRSRSSHAVSSKSGRSGSLQPGKKQGTGLLLKLGIIAIIAAVILYPGYKYLGTLRCKLDKLKEDVASLEKKNEELRKNIEAMEEDSFYLEKLAREMGLVKEGEVIYRIKEVSGDTGKSETEQNGK